MIPLRRTTTGMDSAHFAKYEGLGNDFIVVERAREADFDPRVVPALCDRRFGIGGDGVLLVLPPSSEGEGAARMIVWNADSSRPEMCGNGLRCVALHLALSRGVTELDAAVETDAGLRPFRLRRGGTKDPVVSVDMGVVRVGELRAFAAAGESLDVVLADAGNPHAVVYRPGPTASPGVRGSEAGPSSGELARDFERLAPSLAKDPFFAKGTNVEFFTKDAGGLRVLVWERGVGPTLACGTGACAVVAVACRIGVLTARTPATVFLPGGPLRVTYEPETGRTELEGPAHLVFRGESSLAS
jgi:diaminopimelate epimerase